MEKKYRLMLAIGFSTLFMAIEIMGGIFAHSLAILSDAAHLLTDIFGFAIALLATILAATSATKYYTYGLMRAEILGALASILTLWMMTIWLLWAAAVRVYEWFEGTMNPVEGKLMFIIALIGVFFNICLATVFGEEHGAGGFHGHSHGSHEHDHGEKDEKDIELNLSKSSEENAAPPRYYVCNSHELFKTNHIFCI